MTDDKSSDSFAPPATPAASSPVQPAASSESFAPLAPPGAIHSPEKSGQGKDFKFTKITRTTTTVKKPGKKGAWKGKGKSKKGDRTGKMVRKKGMEKRKLLVMAIVTILIVGMLYSYVIPRTTLQVKTVYHQSLSGNSVAFKLSNTGTRSIDNLSADVEIYDMEGVRIHHMDKEVGIDIGSHEYYEFSTNFRGNQHQAYRIVLTLEFESGDEDFEEIVRHTADKESMNQNWNDRLP